MKLKRLSKKSILQQQTGQSMVEYLVIVAIIGVGTLGLMRNLGQSLNVNYAKIVKSLGGSVEGNLAHEQVEETNYRKKGMGDFMNGTQPVGR